MIHFVTEKVSTIQMLDIAEIDSVTSTPSPLPPPIHCSPDESQNNQYYPSSELQDNQYHQSIEPQDNQYHQSIVLQDNQYYQSIDNQYETHHYHSGIEPSLSNEPHVYNYQNPYRIYSHKGTYMHV